MTDKVLKEIRSKAILGLPMTKEEKAIYLLFVATKEQSNRFLRESKKGGDKDERF